MCRPLREWQAVLVDGEEVDYCVTRDLLGWAKDGCNVIVRGDPQHLRSVIHNCAKRIPGLKARTKVLGRQRLQVLPPQDPEDRL